MPHHPYLQKRLDSLSNADRELLDRELPLSKINLLNVARGFFEITAVSGGTSRHLGSDLTIRDGHSPGGEDYVVDIDVVKPSCIALTPYVYACLLFEFEIGASLQDILPIFRLLVFEKVFYHHPPTLTADNISPYAYEYVRSMHRYVYFDMDNRFHKVTYQIAHDLPLRDGSMYRGVHLEDKLLDKVYAGLGDCASLQEFNELLHSSTLAVRSKQHLRFLTAPVVPVDLTFCVSKIGPVRIRRVPGLPSNRDAFDSIEVEVGLLKSHYGKDVVKKLRPYLPVLNRAVLDKVKNYSYVRNRPGLVDYLYVERISVLPDYTLLYTFRPKEELAKCLA